MVYDFVIIGAGPSGLTLAYLLGKAGKKCIIIDKNESIGGCHRVKRINGFFTEHGPRIYSSSYINTIKLLKTFNIDFNDIFTPYNFTIQNIGGNTLSNMSFREILLLFFEFVKFIFNKNHGRNISMKTFTSKHSFSKKTIEYIDRLCRLTDGAGYEKYSLFQFLNTINQQSFYKIYQPKKPNDKGLLLYLQNAINSTNNVTTSLNTTISKLTYNNKSGTISNVITDKGTTIYGNKFILAVSPKDIISILNNSEQIIKTSFGELENWVNYNSYINDIPITFHWKTKLDIPKIWGFPASDWGIAFIILTDYMDFEDPNSKTVISTCITYLDKPSKFLNKTANQIENTNILIEEVFRQIKEAYPNLPPPDNAFLSPTVFKNQGEWKDEDSAFVMTDNNKFLSPHGKIQNLYNVGTQNGKSLYNFTSFESAVTNAISFSHKISPDTKKYLTISAPFSIRKLIYIIMLFIVIIITIITIFIILKIK